MSAILIINPNSTRINRKTTKEVKAILGRGLNKLKVYVTDRKGEATTIARQAVEKSSELVIAMGGDGTVNEIINGIARSEARLGIIPAGMVNVFALELDLPLNIHQACQVILAGKSRTVDLGRAGDRYFVLMAGVGLDAQIVREVGPLAKKWLRKLAFILNGFKLLIRYNPPELHLELDEEDRELRGYFAVIGNSRYYAGRFGISSLAKLDDGLLDICLFKSKGRLRTLVYTVGVLTNRHLKYRDIEYVRTKGVEITSSPPTLVQIDGEVFRELPMRFEAIPDALEVVVPRWHI